VDLAPLSDMHLVSHTVAAAVGVRESPGRSVDEALVEYLRSRQVLVVLDNCEHLIAACAQLVDPLLRVAPDLKVLATSREALGVTGETVWRVPSMTAPSASDPVAVDKLQQYEAINLFADRAAAVEPSFTLTPANAPFVVDICRRLDGIPLAIELAAARLKVLSLEQINERLKDRFRLLTGGSRTAVARQRTLEATMDWSYDLLSESERVLLCRFSVFPGGWTLEAAEEVCGGHGIEKDRILDLLSRLVDKSLVNVDNDQRGNRRYRCLETVRQYARDRLIALGDAARVRDRHFEFFLAFARRAKPELIRANQAHWIARLRGEHDNLRSALEWSAEDPGRAKPGLELAVALNWFWLKQGALGEGRQWLERFLAVDGDVPPGLRAEAHNGRAMTTFFLGDYTAMRASLEESLTLAREAGNLVEVAMSLAMRALLAMESDPAQMAALAREALDAAIASGEPFCRAIPLEVLSYDAMARGDYETACRLTEEALGFMRELGDRWAIGIHMSDLAVFRLLQGHYAEVEQPCREAITLGYEVRNHFLVAYCLAYLAGAEAARQRGDHAARLWGAAHGLLDTIAVPLQASVQGLVGDRFIEPVKRSLGEEEFHAAFQKGRSMSLPKAVEYALEAR
jgi:non-specific serine/threonine protein kinase